MFNSRDFLRVEYNVLSKNVNRDVSQSEKTLSFNENDIGFTKFCQETLKSHENMLQKYLCPMTFCTGPYCLVP
jgi:hypothetical protein